MRSRRAIVLVLVLLLAAACSSGGKKSSGTTTNSSPGPTSTTTPIAIPQGFIGLTSPAELDDPTSFGLNLSVTSLRDNRPVLAYSVLDQTTGTSKVQVSVFDNATQRFRTPVDVATATLHGNVDSVDIARDTASDALVVTWDDNTTTLMAAVSTDEGATWKPQTVTTDASNLVGEAIAVANGKVVIAYAGGADPIDIATGTLTGTPFDIAPAPAMAGSTPNQLAPGVAVAPDGSVAVAYIVNPDAGGAAVAVTKQGSAQSVIAFDSNGVQNDSPSVDIAYAGNTALVGASLCRVENEDDACTFVSTSTDATTWTAPVQVPADPGAGAPLTGTRVAGATDGHGALAYLPNTGNGENVCGDPKLSLSGDLTTWVTCSPDKDKSLGFGSGSPALAVSGDQSLLLAFQQSYQGAKAPTGILLQVIPPGWPS